MLFPPLRPLLICFIVLACLGWNTRVIRGFGDVLEIDSCGTASDGLGLGGSLRFFGSPCRKRTLYLVGNVDNRDLHVRVLGQADVAVCSEKNMFIQRLPPHAQSVALHVTIPASPCVFRACHGSHHERTTIPDNTCFEWNGIFTQLVQGYWYGKYWPYAYFRTFD